MLDHASKTTIYIEDIEINMTRSVVKTVTDRDIALFAEVSTDHNPVHIDDAYAHQSIFGKRVAHGLLTASLISAVIGEQLPGHGSIYLGQTLKFLAPVFLGDTVRVSARVNSIDLERRHVTLKTLAYVEDKQVLTGEAKVLALSRNHA